MPGEGSDLKIIISAKNLAQKDLDAIKGSLGGIDQAVKNSSVQGQNWGNAWASGANVAKVAMAGFAGFGIAKATEMARDWANAASDMSESANKAGVVFGSAAGQIKEFASTAVEDLGQSEQQATEAAASFGNLFKTMGLGTQDVADMSTATVQLATDLASFHNLKPEEVLEKLRSGLTGEAEPMRALGVLINETTVKAKAMEMGIASASGELTEAQKVQARYALIMQQTKDAQGDFARTSTGLANSQRTADAAMKQAAATLGKELLPVATAATSAFGKALPAATSIAVLWLGSLRDAGAGVIGILQGIASAAGNAADQISHLGGATGWENLPENPELERMYSQLPGQYARGTRGMRTAAEAAAKAAAERAAAASDLADSYNRASAAADQATASIQRAEQAQASAAASDIADSYNRIRTAAGLTAETENIAEAQAKAAAEAKKFGAEVENALERATNGAQDLERAFSDEVGGAIIRASEIQQDYGDRWIEKLLDIQRAQADVKRGAEEALEAMSNQEILDASIASRRQNLNDRLAGLKLTHQREVEDAEARWQLEHDLARETDEEQRKAIRERFEEQRELTAHRRELADREARWEQENILKPQAELERQLHQEEQDRRRAAILKERDDKIAALNTEWDQWQKAESAKTEKAKQEELQRAKDKLIAIKGEYLDKIADAAGPGIDALKGKIEAAFGASFAQLEAAGGGDGGGSSDPAAGHWENGRYVDPRREPGGEIFEAWKAGNPEQYEAWKQEHGLAEGGIVTMPGLFAIGENAPRVKEAVIPLPSGGIIDYDRLARAVAAALRDQPPVVSIEDIYSGLARRSRRNGGLGL